MHSVLHVAWNVCAVIGIFAIICGAVMATVSIAAARGWNPFE